MNGELKKLKKRMGDDVMEKMKMESVDGVQKNIEIIEKYFPNCITEDKCAGGGDTRRRSISNR